MGWAEEQQQQRANEKYGERARAQTVNPQFVKLADAVLENLNDGFSKAYPGLNRWLDAGIEFCAQSGFKDAIRTLSVRPDYSRLLFVVKCGRMAKEIPQKHVRVDRLPSVITPEFVDRVSREIIQDYIAQPL